MAKLLPTLGRKDWVIALHGPSPARRHLSRSLHSELHNLLDGLALLRRLLRLLHGELHRRPPPKGRDPYENIGSGAIIEKIGVSSLKQIKVV